MNDAGTGNWVFDQPSVVANGSVLHVAFVGNNAAGADSASLNTRLYYAAVNGAADFTNKATTRSQVLVTAPVAIDNGPLHINARHPQIALRSATELAILFQAIPVGDDNYKLFRAKVTIGNNAVTSQRVDEIRDAAGARIPGKLTDPSFALVPNDDTMRIAFSSFPSLVAVPPYSDVYYARVGLDNARVVGNTILLTKTASSTGVSPLPRLRLDGNNYSHIVWAANNRSRAIRRRRLPRESITRWCIRSRPASRTTIAIGATQVLSGGYRWGFPNVLLSTAGNIWILAADEPFRVDGIGGIRRNRRDQPVRRDARREPGERQQRRTRIPRSSSTRREDPCCPPTSTRINPRRSIDSQNRLHVAGYGFLYADGHGTPGRYYVTSLGTTASGTRPR